tara:strand:- start:1224 stop:2291 length:1068 start_codon:yes stop_codon:yes gene_type:complete
VGRTWAQPLLCGYYGEHNLGDDALLEALLLQLPPGVQPWVTAADQALVEQQFQLRSCNRHRLVAVLAALSRCDALIFGGGSLLQDSTSFRSLLYYAALIISARLQGKPVLLWGQGLGPLNRRRSRLLVRGLLPLVTAACWRDPDSAALAGRLGRRPGASDGVGSDPVWGLPPQQWRGLGGAIVVSWRSTPLLKAGQWRLLLGALCALAENTDRAVIWLPFHAGQDVDLFRQLDRAGLMPAALTQRTEVMECGSVTEAMTVFSRAGLVLAMRLHALILGALAGSPVAALSYDPKVAAAAAGLSCPCLPLNQPLPEAAELTDIWQQVLDVPPEPKHLRSLAEGAAQHRRLLRSAVAP